MPIQHFISRVNGTFKRVFALDKSTGSADAGKVVALNVEGKIDKTMLPDAVDTADLIPTTENLSAGDFVNIYRTEGGILSVRLADNSNARIAHGFVKEAFTTGTTASIYTLGVINAHVTGLAIGERCYLGTTGKVMQTPLDEASNANTGYISQYLGIAKSANEILTIQEDGISL